MKMKLKIGYTSSGSSETVWYDSLDPDSREEVGYWFATQVHMHPGLLQAGGRTDNSLKHYCVIEVKSPIFDSGGWYVRNSPDAQAQKVDILSAVRSSRGWSYAFQTTKDGVVYTLPERKLLRFLTESVELEVLL